MEMVNTARFARHLRTITLILFLTAGINGCGYLTISRSDNVMGKPALSKGNESIPIYNSAVIKGTVVRSDDIKRPTLLIAYNLSSGSGAIADYVLLDNTQSFMLYLPEGRYHLYTVTDFNNDGIYKDSEITGVYGSPSAPAEIALVEGDVVKGIVIHADRDRTATIAPPQKFSIKEDEDMISQRTYTGQIVKVYSEMFSPDNGATGWWNPTTFMKAFGAHIYFLEPYDPRKIPVLFVHGAEGCPQNWIHVLIRMDRSRYQPWFFYYPSGIRLPLATQLLYDELTELQGKYGWEKMVIAAHSMGGLVTRSLLTRYPLDENLDIVYVTFATPWAGYGAADASQIIPHKSIPIWTDIRSQSLFIKRTLGAPLLPNVRYYLFYGREDTTSRGKALDERATSGARETIGMDCNHETILTDRNVFLKFKNIMDKAF